MSLKFMGLKEHGQIFIYSFLEQSFFLLINVIKGGWEGPAFAEAPLLGPDPVYPPLTTPFFDLLTAADGKDMSLEL